MKPEFITLISRTFNKQIEILYILEKRTETMIYDRVKTKFNSENSKISLVYWHSVQHKKSFYFPIIDNVEIDLFTNINTQ